jgi:hypothetical protein
MYQHVNLEKTKIGDYNNEIVGKRVRFKSTSNSRSILRFNDLGTVIAADILPDLKGRRQKLWIRWDNGNNYPLIDGVDTFDIFREAVPNAVMRWPYIVTLRKAGYVINV